MKASIRFLNIASAVVGTFGLAALLSTSHLLDGPSDAQARIDTARSTQDAERDAQRHARFERAARRLCGGQNAAFVLTDDNAVQCLTHQGRKTITAKVAL